jgi:hypothetical protein
MFILDGTDHLLIFLIIILYSLVIFYILFNLSIKLFVRLTCSLTILYRDLFDIFSDLALLPSHVIYDSFNLCHHLFLSET